MSLSEELDSTTRDTENQNLISRMPLLTSMSSNCGTARMNSSYSAGVAYPITRSTPARLYQERSNRMICPAPGRCGT